jgi:dCTP deaminase
VELLQRPEIQRRLNLSDKSGLFIDPLLDQDQVGEVTIDLRLGCDFLVSVLTRKPFINIVKDDGGFRGLASYYRGTRRELGDRLVLYPNQLVLACTLEYVALPSDVYADVLTRSSYTRLGVHMNTMIQPGFRGCFPIELFNSSNNPVELVVGSRVFQTRLFALQEESDYSAGSEPRKYLGNVRPVVSRAAQDADLPRLFQIQEKR